MKDPRGCGILSILALGLISVFLVGWADSWEEIRKGAGEVKTVQARFVQEKHLKILSKPLISKGLFFFRAPASLRWEYESPVRSIMLMHEGRTRRVIEKEGTFHEDAGANLQSMHVVVQEITRWLGGRFDDNPDFAAELAPGPTIVLTPKNASLSAIIQRIELALSDKPGVIRSVIIHESENSFTRMIFEDAELNAPIPNAVFREIQ
ncbi:MAG: outer membrane lipoprotein carrier protein LolA [Desulfobacterales bacterium]|nr:outer membrane lipoprotein carrier protein LolA [Desulfobacterales bacterium]